MKSFGIRRIRSNIEGDFAWVSLWFGAGPGRLWPLHFVCQKGDKRAGPRCQFDTVYLERDDQAIACYGGAKRVRVGNDRIEIHLNPKGVRALGLDRSLELLVPEGLVGWKKASRVFR